MDDEYGEAPATAMEPLPPIQVHIPHQVDTQPQAADYGAWTAYKLAGTEAAQPILPFDQNRHRAVIIVSAVAASTAVIYVGTQAQVQQKLGGILAANGPAVTVENNQALWMAPDGTNPCTVTVLVERWDSGT